MALIRFAACVVTHFGGCAPRWGAMIPKFAVSTYPQSFIILCLPVRKLSNVLCYSTMLGKYNIGWRCCNRQTHGQTDRCTDRRADHKIKNLVSVKVFAQFLCKFCRFLLFCFIRPRRSR